MNIQPINSIQNRTNFKSAYPVYHWVKVAGESFAPAMTDDLNRTLNRKLVSFLNAKQSEKKPKTLIVDKITKYLAAMDASFRENPIVRSFYSHRTIDCRSKDDAVAFLITGNDVAGFEDAYAKNIGILKSQAPLSAELDGALATYKYAGMNFVEKKLKQFKLGNERMALHTKFEVERKKNGTIKGYKLLDIKFCPATGENSPLTRYYNFVENKK